jgi:hypothetical protein
MVCVCVCVCVCVMVCVIVCVCVCVCVCRGFLLRKALTRGPPTQSRVRCVQHLALLETTSVVTAAGQIYSIDARSNAVRGWWPGVPRRLLGADGHIACRWNASAIFLAASKLPPGHPTTK